MIRVPSGARVFRRRLLAASVCFVLGIKRVPVLTSIYTINSTGMSYNIWSYDEQVNGLYV